MGAWRRRASPKSSTFASPSGEISTLSGFTSPWITPTSWAAARASPICSAQRSRVAHGVARRSC
ncbi:MAG: hypothetical protein U0168_12480 [Nannocystaceae bacterium]